MKRAIFLDRDGVVNELVFYPEQGIIDSPMISSQVILVFGIERLIKFAKKLGYIVLVCSNQPGVGLGKITLKNLYSISLRINSQLRVNGASIDKFYYCLHHKYAKIKNYRINCECRKPKIGLILEAAKELDINLSQSWMVGDGIDDIKAGKNAGCKTILLANISSFGNLRILEQKLESIEPDFMVKKLTEIIKILKESK